MLWGAVVDITAALVWLILTEHVKALQLQNRYLNRVTHARRISLWMREQRVWPFESEDNLRIGPCTNGDRRSAVAQQYVASGLDRWAIDVSADEKRAAFDALFPSGRFAGLETRMLERA